MLKLRTDAQVLEFRDLGERLQKEIARALLNQEKTRSAELSELLQLARGTYENISVITEAAQCVNRYAESNLGMNIEGLIVALGGSKGAVNAGLFGALSITNNHVKRVLKELSALNGKIERGEK